MLNASAHHIESHRMAVRFISYTSSPESQSDLKFSLNDAIQYVEDISEKSMVGNPNQTS